MLVISSEQIGSMETSVLLRFRECFQNLLMRRAALLLVLAVLTFVVDEAQDSWRLIAAASQSLGRFWTDIFFCTHLSLHLSCCAPGMWVACPETALYPSSWVPQLGGVCVCLNSTKFPVSFLKGEV